MAGILNTAKEMFSGSPVRHKRVIFIGTRNSGKTVALGCLSLACDLRSIEDKNFRHFIDEKTSGICQVPSDLCEGLFPEATPPGLIYEADLIMKQKTVLGEKTLITSWCETSGEDVANLIGPYQKSVYQRSVDWQDAQTLNRYICDSDGYVLVLPTPRARIWNGQAIDQEPDNLLSNPDVNLKRILSAIYRYKRQTRSPPIQGIAVLLTKYDMVDAILKSRGMSLNDPIGARQFLGTYFRQTTGMLKFYGLENVKFFPVFVQVEKRKNPTMPMGIEFVKRDDGRGYKILTDPEQNLPIFSHQQYTDLITWMLQTFA